MRDKIAKLLFIIGIILLLFPIVSRIITNTTQTSVVYKYEDNISSIEKKILDSIKARIEEYNFNLSNNKPTVVIDESIDKLDYSSSFDFYEEGETIGSINIPKIETLLPIYDDIVNNNLEKGAVHLKDTSYPNGQIGTHSVIVGHSGLTIASIFDNIDKLQMGDIFSINYLGIVTNYKVISTKVVLPYETENLKIDDNKCLVTLVTCTPKGVNSHRLLVTGEKIELEENNNEKKKTKNYTTRYYIIAALILLFATSTLIVFAIIDKKNKKEA